MSRVPYSTSTERAAAAEAVADHLAAGGIVAYPTETVYGLGCLLVPEALRLLAEFKGDRPFLVLIRGEQDVQGLRWSPVAERLAERFWPGPLTLAVPDPDRRFPDQVRSAAGTVAVRVSPNPAVADLLRAAGGPVTSTSANVPGGEPAMDAEAAVALGDRIPRLLVLDGGRLPPARPSTIVECAEGVRLVREGAVPRADLQEVVDLE